MNTSTPVTVLKQVKESFREEVSALVHEGLTADEIHALVNDVIKNGHCCPAKVSGGPSNQLKISMITHG
jgi:methionine aminopeptidase